MLKWLEVKNTKRPTWQAKAKDGCEYEITLEDKGDYSAVRRMPMGKGLSKVMPMSMTLEIANEVGWPG